MSVSTQKQCSLLLFVASEKTNSGRRKRRPLFVYGQVPAATSRFGNFHSGTEFGHHLVEIGFALKPDAGQRRQGDVAVLHPYAVGEATKGLKQVGIGFIAAQAESGCDVERHLMSAMRNTTRRRPAIRLQHLERAEKFDKAVTQCAIELQPVDVLAHAAVADEVAGIRR